MALRKYVFVFAFAATACQSGNDKTNALQTDSKELVLTSLLGKDFYEPERSDSEQAALDTNLVIVQKNFEADPSEENYIWYGRREAYLYHLNKAIDIFSEGIEQYPDSYKLLRHRGHRYISIRQFDKAIADFEKAVQLMEGKEIEIEPDGQPNKLNIPLSNTQFNVWYHLGLAHYLKGDFAKAEDAYKQCMQVSDNNDLFIATADWLYMTFRRQGKLKDAEELLTMVVEGMPVIENDSYYRRLKLYKGLLQVDDVLNPDPQSVDFDLALATQGYGVGNWYLYNGDSAKAKEIFEKIVSGKHFTAFGFIAAEAELARWQ